MVCHPRPPLFHVKRKHSLAAHLQRTCKSVCCGVYAMRMADIVDGVGLVPAPGNGQGIAPYGVRHDGSGAKGRGFMGLLSLPGGGQATEYSIGADVDGREMEIPSIVPGMSPEQLQAVLGGNVTPDVVRLAITNALMRQRAGKGAFAAPGELRYPPPVSGLPVRGGIPGVNGIMLPPQRELPPFILTPGGGARG